MTTYGSKIDPDYRREEVTTQAGGVEHQEQIIEDKGAEKRLFAYRLTQLIVLLFGILEGLIGIRILLRLISANPGNSFAHFIFEVTDKFVRPFATLVTNPGSQGMVLEVTSIIAVLVYALICWVLVKFIRIVLTPTKNRTVSIVNKERIP